MIIGVNLIQYTELQGIETFIQNMLAHWPLAKEDRLILFTNQKSYQLFAALNPRAEIISKNLKSRRFSLLLYQQFQLPRQLRKAGVDILLCPSLALPLFYRRKIVVIHDLAFRRYPEESGSLSRFYLNLALLSAKYLSRGLATVSEYARQEISALLKIEIAKIINISEGVPLAPSAYSDQMAVALKDLPPLFFLYIGRAYPRKNLNTLIHSFQIFIKSHPDFSLLIAGQYDKRMAALRQTAEKLGLSQQIRFLDFITADAKRILIKEARALVLISHYEGFGLPVLEAQAAGLPVLAAQASSLPEIAGEGALFVDPNNQNNIVAGMAELADDKNLRQELIRRGYENIKRYSWEKSAEKLYDILKNSLKA